MKYTQKFVLILGVLALGISSNVVSGQGAARQCASEECACEEALNQNTVEALEDFLRKYPQSVNNKESACGALAVPPEDEGGDSQSTDERTPVQSGDASTGG